jgi:hypothetical protein
MEEELFHLFPGSLAHAVAIHDPVTQVSVTHVASVVFDYKTCIPPVSLQTRNP